MKKILCLLLALFLALAVPCGALAVQTDRDYEIINSWEEEGLITTEIKVGSSNGFDIHVYAFSVGWQPCDLIRIGLYCFAPSVLQSTPNHLDIYAVKGDKKVFLDEAYEQGLINLDEVARLVDGFCYDSSRYDVYPVGDVNQDKTLNVEDVVLLQRNLAKEIYLGYEDFSYEVLVLDCNLDGKSNMQDVLIMQRLIAKMPVALP